MDLETKTETEAGSLPSPLVFSPAIEAAQRKVSLVRRNRSELLPVELQLQLRLLFLLLRRVHLCAAVPNGAEHGGRAKGGTRRRRPSYIVEGHLTASLGERGLIFWAVRWAGLGGLFC